MLRLGRDGYLPVFNCICKRGNKKELPQNKFIPKIMDIKNKSMTIGQNLILQQPS